MSTANLELALTILQTLLQCVAAMPSLSALYGVARQGCERMYTRAGVFFRVLTGAVPFPLFPRIRPAIESSHSRDVEAAMPMSDTHPRTVVISDLGHSFPPSLSASTNEATHMPQDNNHDEMQE
ncbi:hypothetical protein VTN96DRAFT_4598 [Rasamsonia emersonii]